MEKALQRQKEKIRVVSLYPDSLGHDKAVKKIAELAEKRTGAYVCFSTVHMVMESHDSEEFGRRVNSADVIITDGMPLVWMQKLQGSIDAERVRANDLMMSLMAYAEKNDLKIGFYGGKQEVLDAIRERAAREYPRLKIVYMHSPPFRKLTQDEDAEIVDEINRAEPELLFMGLGCPKQENWMFEHRTNLNCVMLGVGASFDFYAGNVKESPAWMGKLGLEWLYRLTREPKRLWRRYLILNPRFIALCLRQLIFERKR